MTPALTRTPAEWFAIGSSILDDVLTACARYGVRPHPAMRLVATPSPFPYYEPASNTIAFGVPDVTTVKGRLYWYFIQSLYGATDLSEVASLLDEILPCVMAHELGHHLRHAYGAPIDSDFVEEQVANHIAIAFLGEHPSYRRTLPEVRRWSARMLERGKARATAGMPEFTPFRLDVGDVLLARGVVTRRCLDDALALAEAAEVAPEKALAAMGIPIEKLERAANDRTALAANFNRAYMSDLAQYWLFGSEWLVTYIDREPLPTLGEALDRHLLGADWEAGRRDASRAIVTELLRGDDPLLAAAAAAAIADLDGAVVAAPANEEDPVDPVEALRRREDRGSPPAVAEWRALAASSLARARTLLDLEATSAGHPTLAVLCQAAGEARRRVALTAVRSAGHTVRPSLEIGERALASPDPTHRAAGLRLLARCLGPRSAPYLAVLSTAPPAHRPAWIAEVLRKASADPDPLVRALAASAAGEREPMLSIIEKLMYLRVVPTFAGLEVEAVRALADLAITVHYRAGEAIFAEGDLGDCLYVITEGRIALEVGGSTVAELSARQHFGEMSLFDSGRRSAGATAQRDTTLLRLDHDDFFRLGHRHPEILAGVIAVLGERLRAANVQLAAAD